MDLQKSQEKAQIYLLMGYLGSGKTTFIRNLLLNKKNKKYAVIQNEFASGQMGIQQPLIMDQSGTPFSSFLELPNGCICCSAKNDLIASIEYIIANTDVRNIVVQTNGLANPGQSIKQFWFDEQMKINGYLHSVISIFSVQKFKDLQDKQLFQKQIVFANKALITFIDKSSNDQAGELQEYIKQRNAECEIKRNDNYDIIDFLSGKSLFDIKSLNEIQKQSHTCSNSCQKQHHKHSHHNINSIFIKGKSQVSKKHQIQTCVGQLLWESGIKVLRVKGVFSLESSETVYELQGVDDVFEVKETKTNKQKYNNQTKILIIIEQTQENNYQKRIKEILKVQ